MTTRAKIQSQIKKVQKRVNAQTSKGKKQIAALRAKAANAALSWVMSHEDRVEAFRGSVSGTPVAKVVDVLLALLRDAAGPKAKAKPAAKRKVKARTAKR